VGPGSTIWDWCIEVLCTFIYFFENSRTGQGPASTDQRTISGQSGTNDLSVLGRPGTHNSYKGYFFDNSRTGQGPARTDQRTVSGHSGTNDLSVPSVLQISFKGMAFLAIHLIQNAKFVYFTYKEHF
jgi:hypothetical protein